MSAALWLGDRVYFTTFSPGASGYKRKIAARETQRKTGPLSQSVILRNSPRSHSFRLSFSVPLSSSTSGRELCTEGFVINPVFVCLEKGLRASFWHRINWGVGTRPGIVKCFASFSFVFFFCLARCRPCISLLWCKRRWASSWWYMLRQGSWRWIVISGNKTSPCRADSVGLVVCMEHSQSNYREGWAGVSRGRQKKPCQLHLLILYLGCSFTSLFPINLFSQMMYNVVLFR